MDVMLIIIMKYVTFRRYGVRGFFIHLRKCTISVSPKSKSEVVVMFGGGGGGGSGMPLLFHFSYNIPGFGFVHKI